MLKPNKSFQFLDSYSYQIILHLTVIYMPSTQTLACLMQVPCIFIYLFSNLHNFPIYSWAVQVLLIHIDGYRTLLSYKATQGGNERTMSEQLSFPYHKYQRQSLTIYSCLPFRLHYTHNSFTNHCPSYLLFKDTAADEAIFYVWLQRLYTISN